MNDLIIKWYNWLKTKQWSVETWIINLLGMGSDFRLIQLLALIPVTYTPSVNLLSSLKRTRCQRSICQIPRATPAACWGHLRGSGSAPHASPRTEEQMGVLLLGCCPPAPPSNISWCAGLSPGALDTVLGDTANRAEVCMDVPSWASRPARALEKCYTCCSTHLH